MTGANAGTRGDDEGDVAALVVARWLRFAAAPIFTTMALLAVVFDSNMPSMLCSAAGSSTLDGMAPMYLLMTAFRLGPWLKLISRRRNAAWHDSFPESRSF